MPTPAERLGLHWGSEEADILERTPANPQATVAKSRTVATALLLSVSYYLGVRAGFALTLENTPVSLLWPTNAFVLAALLLSPPRSWPILIAAVLPAHLLAELSVDVPLSMVLCWFVSNVTEALIGAIGIRWSLGRAPRFARFHELVMFLTWCVVLGPFLSSFLDTAFVAANGWLYVDYWSVWRTRLFSNVLAALTIVPPIIIWAQCGLRPWRQATLKQIAEAVVLVGGLCLTSYVVFLRRHPDPQEVMLLYVPLLFLVWAAMRSGVSGVSLCVVIVASFAISGVLQDRGPFSAGDPRTNALGMQVFLIIAATGLMFLAVSLAELHHARLTAIRRGERLQLALAAAQMGTWDWDVDRDRFTWSLGGGTSLPRSGDEGWSTATLLQGIHPDDRVRVSHAIAQALAGANEIDVEFRWVTEPETHWVAAKGTFDQEGSVRRMLGVHMDTTERKVQDLQMQSQRDQLAHLSRVSMLGELSGALAHELNQPLTAIMTNAQAAYRKMRAASPDLVEIEEILTDIIAEDKRAGEVIRRLRALFVKGALELRPLDVNECIRDVLALEHSDLVARNVSVQAVLAADLPWVNADRVQLQQVLLNLIVNACDAMKDNSPGDRLLQIKSQQADRGGIDIEICDRGTGIANLDKIFEPFRSTKQHGLGLGLAICHTIIRTHQGRLWAMNNSSRGATMHIFLPAVAE
ncbi:MAG: MASE1 domain-containing protein [Steroidobacteraceae bacterium]